MDYKKYLTDEILAHYLALQTDLEDGGILNCFDEECRLLRGDKDVWFQGRAMWTYSLAYRLIEPRQEYLDICEHVFEFLKKLPRVDGRVPYMVSKNGAEVLRTQGITFYGDCFCAMGCAQYYRLCKKAEVKEMAEKLFCNCYNGYFSQQNSAQTTKAPIPSRVFGLNMAMLAGAQFVRNAGICVDKANELADACIKTMMDGRFVDDLRKMVIEFVPLEGYSISNGDNHSCPGHVYEAAWFVLCEGEYRDDDGIRAFGRKLLDYAMPEGFEEHTTLIPTYLYLDRPYDFTRTDTIISWPQQEAIIAYRLAYSMFGDEKYKRLSDIIERTAFAYFADPDQKRWYIDIGRSDPPVSERSTRGGHIEGPFHLERMLLGLSVLEETGNILNYIS